MIDTFATYEDLAAQMSEGADYRITVQKTNSPYLIVAIHGGKIEPFTSEIATAIAGEEHNLYLFEGIRGEGNDQLHIGSRYFNEPRLQELVRGVETVVAIHAGNNSENEFVSIGGLGQELTRKIIDHVEAIDVTIREFEARMETESLENICNRGMARAGVALKLSKRLCDTLREDSGMQRLFTNAIRHALG